MPGVLVEVTSPALIEKVRSATSDENGQYRITNLPVGTYSVTFTLRRVHAAAARQHRPDDRIHRVGQRDDGRRRLAETVTVTAESPVVDVQNARQVAAFEGEADP